MGGDSSGGSAEPGGPREGRPSPGLRALLDGLAGAQPAVAEALQRLEAAGGDEPGVAAALRYFAGRWRSAEAQALFAAELDALPADAPARLQRALRVAAVSPRSRGAEADTTLPVLLRLEEELRVAGDEHLLMVLVSDLARVYTTRGESTRSLELFEEAIDLARKRGEPYFEGLNLLNLGFCFGERDEPRPYARFTRAALRVFEALGDPQGVAMACINLGGALQRLDEIDEAEAHYARAEQLLSGGGLPYLEALCRGGQGGLACKRGQLERGRALYERANLLLAELNNPYQIARHDLLLGIAFAEAGRLLEARALLLRAADRARGGGGSRQTRSLALLQLAGVEERRGELAAANAALREHIDLQQLVFDELLEGRLRSAQQRAALDAARAQVEHERRAADALRGVNAELQAALERQEALQAQLRELARTDPLTGLVNRRAVREQLDAELSRLRRCPRPLCLLLIDVDHFKKVNDQHSLLAGDDALVELSHRLRASLRASDLVARWGGEELLVALLDTDLGAGQAVAEALRSRVAGRPVHSRAGPLTLTISVGVAAVQPAQPDLDDTLRRADLALYEAKRRGRDRVVVA
ncbi:MAG: diguanylate cyclase [Deltaproteobacteria bacterium]|nr:diguanylate cyclase [Deltaproteobacteria bacterium]